jgi:hypothetical protein
MSTPTKIPDYRFQQEDRIEDRRIRTTMRSYFFIREMHPYEPEELAGEVSLGDIKLMMKESEGLPEGLKTNKDFMKGYTNLEEAVKLHEEEVKKSGE